MIELEPPQTTRCPIPPPGQDPRRGRRLGRLAAILGASFLTGCGAPAEHLGPLDPGTGNQVNVDFVDVEPNNTPEQATPLGVANSSDLVIWLAGDEIGGEDDPADYFVFRSASASGELQFNMCYAPPITGMTATLWKVVDAKQQMPPIQSWTISTTCETSFSAPLEASTVYLFGVEATGGPGLYTA